MENIPEKIYLFERVILINLILINRNIKNKIKGVIKCSSTKKNLTKREMILRRD
jgi:hypothetical protein